MSGIFAIPSKPASQQISAASPDNKGQLGSRSVDLISTLNLKVDKEIASVEKDYNRHKLTGITIFSAAILAEIPTLAIMENFHDSFECTALATIRSIFPNAYPHLPAPCPPSFLKFGAFMTGLCALAALNWGLKIHSIINLYQAYQKRNTLKKLETLKESLNDSEKVKAFLNHPDTQKFLAQQSVPKS